MAALKTRDPRSIIASGAGTVGWTAIVSWLRAKFFPDLGVQDATMILGGLILVWNGAGSLARDYAHDLQERGEKVPFLVRKVGKWVG